MLFNSEALGLGWGTQRNGPWSGTALTRLQYLFNGFAAPDTYTSGAIYVPDNLGNIVTAGVNRLAIPGMRLATTVADGAELGPELWVSPVLGTQWVDNLDGSYTLTGDGTYSQISIQGLPGGHYKLYFDYVTSGRIGARINTSTVGVTPIGVDRAGYASFDIIGVLGQTATIGIARLDSGVVVTATVWNISLREVIPTWVNDDGAGTPLFSAVSRDTETGTVIDYAADANYKGMSVWPARTNVFLNSLTPATQNITTTAQVYTVSVEGTGSATLSGTMTGVATAGSPVTATATAGTLTVTIAGTPTHVQVEAGVFASPRIVTGATSVTRAATVASFNSAGRIREQNCAVWLRRYVYAAGQTAWALNSYTDSSNEIGIQFSPTTLLLRKRLAGADTDLPLTFAHAVGFNDVQIAWTDKGMMIRASADRGATWAAWAENASVSAAVIAATFQHCRSGAGQLEAGSTFTASLFLPTKATLAEYQEYVSVANNWQNIGG